MPTLDFKFWVQLFLVGTETDYIFVFVGTIKRKILRRIDLAQFDYIILGSQTEDVHSLTRDFTATHKEYFTVEAFQKIVFKRFFWRNLLVYPVIKYKEKVIVFKKLN
jgi:hypothetical protein